VAVLATVPGKIFTVRPTAEVRFGTATGTLTWHIRGVGTVAWGKWGMDGPAPADYIGDKRTDIAVVRFSKTEQPTPLTWYVRGASPVTWGLSSDLPVPANYIRGRHDDIAVWRESTGQWFIRGLGRTVTWGGPYDTPVPGDYIGDKRTDLAVVRLSITDGVDPSRLPLIWYIRTL
jgi:hypothetical protein